MFLSASEIDNSIHWLLGNASSPVRYLTHKHILKTDPASLQKLWEDVTCSSAAEEIFSHQNADGSWFSGGPWGPKGYRRQTGRGYTYSRPKFVTTAWILPYLGEMGFTVADERIKRSCETMLQETGYPNFHPEPPAQEVNCCGLYAIPLRAFASVDMAVDERLQGAWNWLTWCQRTDGGWLNPHHLANSPTPSKTRGRWPWDRSCAWGSFYATQALYFAANTEMQRMLPAALAFLQQHLLHKDSKHIQTWVYHGHNTVKELLMFSSAGLDMQAPPITTLLDWLKSYYRPGEGVFRTQDKPIPNFIRHISAIRRNFEEKYGSNYWTVVSKTSAPVLRYHLYHLVEDDWLTYYLTRIAVNIAHANSR